MATAFASVALGHLSDRVRDRRLLVMLSAALGGLAYGLIYLAPTRAVFLLTFGAILRFGGAMFSQSFAFSRACFDRNAPDRAEFMTSLLRTMFSAAWVVVPPVAGYTVARFTAAASASLTGALLLVTSQRAGRLG